MIHSIIRQALQPFVRKLAAVLAGYEVRASPANPR
jgi:hypothetical protein